MGKLIDITDILRMRRLEADIERAGNHMENPHFHEEFVKMLELRSLTCNNIILPPKSEEF